MKINEMVRIISGSHFGEIGNIKRIDSNGWVGVMLTDGTALWISKKAVKKI